MGLCKDHKEGGKKHDETKIVDWGELHRTAETNRIAREGEEEEEQRYPGPTPSESEDDSSHGPKPSAAKAWFPLRQ